MYGDEDTHDEGPDQESVPQSSLTEENKSDSRFRGMNLFQPTQFGFPSSQGYFDGNNH